MLVADYVTLGVALLIVLIGAACGFDRIFEWLLEGVNKKITVGVTAYFLNGSVLALPFLASFITAYVDKWVAADNFGCNVLLFLRPDLILFGVVIKFLISLVFYFCSGFFCGLMSDAEGVLKWINRLLGATVLLVYVSLWVLTVFQLSAWIFGIDGGLYHLFEGSAIGMDLVYQHNPLNFFFETIKHSFTSLFS